MGNKDNKNRTVKVIAVLLAALVLAFITCLPGVQKDVTLTSGSSSTDLLSKDCVVNDASFDAGSGEYEAVPGGDSFLLYEGVGQKAKGVYLKLAEAASEDITFKVYWTKSGDKNLSEKLSRSFVIKAGHDSAFVRVSSYELDLLRINISGDCRIDELLLSDGKVKTKYYFTGDFFTGFAIKAVLFFAILFLSMLSFEEEDEKTGFIKSIFIGKEKKDSYRYELDHVRTVAAIMVIMMHSICDIFIPHVERGDAGYGILRFVLAASLGCNALYVMLSGCLILRPGKGTLKEFYLGRMVRVIIPTLCYYVLYMTAGYGKEMFGNGIGEGLKRCGKELLSGRSDYMPHIWLVYTILGLYILAPFLRILLEHISEQALFGLLLAGFIVNVLIMYLPLLKLSFGIETPVASWTGLFLLGYYMNTEHAKRFYNVFMILGILGAVCSFVMIYLNPDILYYTCNQAPNMWLVGAGVFAFYNKFKNVFGKKNIVIEAISKYNFSIMLVHILLLMKLVLPIGWRLEYEYGHLSFFIMMIIVVCLVLSYICAVIYDNTVVKAVMYLYNRLSGLMAKTKKAAD